MFLVTIVTESGYVFTARMTRKQIDACRLEIVEAIPL